MKIMANYNLMSQRVLTSDDNATVWSQVMQYCIQYIHERNKNKNIISEIMRIIQEDVWGIKSCPSNPDWYGLITIAGQFIGKFDNSSALSLNWVERRLIIKYVLLAVSRPPPHTALAMRHESRCQLLHLCSRVAATCARPDPGSPVRWFYVTS